MNVISKILVLIFILLLTISIKANAHPWGGLVIDNEGNIYFTFICPMVDSDNHYACVWKLTPDNKITHILSSQQSPSDIVLSRNPNREIFAAERSGQNPRHSNSFWKIENSGNQLLIPRNTNHDQFYIQSIAVNKSQGIFFAKENNLYYRDGSNSVEKITNQSFERIGLTSWGKDEKLYFMSGDDIFVYDGTEYKLVISDLRKENPENLPFSGANIFFDMAVDENNNIFLAYYGNREVIKISSDGVVETILKSEEPWSPHGIDIFNGEIYILESTITGDNWWKFWKENPGIIPRVRKISSNGSISTVYNFADNLKNE